MRSLRECFEDLLPPFAALFLLFWSFCFAMACHGVVGVAAGHAVWRVVAAVAFCAAVSGCLGVAAVLLARWWWFRPADEDEHA